MFKSCLTQKLKAELRWRPGGGGKKAIKSCGRQLLGHCLISGLLSLPNPKAKTTKVNSSLASMASTQPTPCVPPIQNIGLSGVNPPVGTIHQVLITIWGEGRIAQILSKSQKNLSPRN